MIRCTESEQNQIWARRLELAYTGLHSEAYRETVAEIDREGGDWREIALAAIGDVMCALNDRYSTPSPRPGEDNVREVDVEQCVVYLQDRLDSELYCIEHDL